MVTNNVAPISPRDKAALRDLHFEGYPDLKLEAQQLEVREDSGVIRVGNGAFHYEGWASVADRADMNQNQLQRMIERGTFMKGTPTIQEMAEVYNSFNIPSDELNLYTCYSNTLNLSSYGVHPEDNLKICLLLNTEIETDNFLRNHSHLLEITKAEYFSNEVVRYEDKYVKGSIINKVLRLYPKTEDYNIFRIKLAYLIYEQI